MLKTCHPKQVLLVIPDTDSWEDLVKSTGTIFPVELPQRLRPDAVAVLFEEGLALKLFHGVFEPETFTRIGTNIVEDLPKYASSEK